MKRLWLVLAATLMTACGGHAAQFVRPTAAVVALTHVRVIDGTGDPGKDDQTVIIEHGRIAAVGDASAVRIPAGTSTIDLHGRTLIPGLVGMHDHLFYQLEPAPGSTTVIEADHTFARLYLASGVTTIRTAGTVDFGADARIKRQIDAGQEPGPKIHLTGTYLSATGTAPDPDGIARQVARDADRGATSFKAYTTLRASELKAAITAAHERGLTITGHLCAVGFREAVALGIDNIEHGIALDSELYSGKRPDECPNQWDIFGALRGMDPGDSEIRQTITALVRHGVAVTSTLAVLESYAIDESEVDRRVPVLISSRLQDTFQQARDRRKDRATAGQSLWAGVLSQEMLFERAFVNAGGKLLAGADPTGWGSVVAGYGDQRELELLVSAGFSAEQSIAIATSNGASFLKDRTVGRIAEGLQADLVVLQGNPSQHISDVRNVELVFKDGVAYDPERLEASASGTLGEFMPEGLFTLPVIILITGLGLLAAWRATQSLRHPRLAVAASLVVCVVAVTASAACATTNRQAPARAPADAPAPSVGATAAVPHRPWQPLQKGHVDISTGIYIREDDDLVLNTPLPIVLRRTYNSGDGFSRRFGLDTTHPGEWWIHGDGDPSIPCDLILATGGRIHFVRISPGHTQEGAVLRHDSTPTEFNGALLSWTGSLWEMRFLDGSMASFRDCEKDRGACSLIERRDPDGHRIAYVRDASGTLLRMESEGQSIGFDYDDHKRIVRAYDTAEREVLYAYDDRGRLIRATASDGIVRTYEYDERHKLVEVREPGRILQNWFDDEGRSVKQVMKASEHDDHPYVATARYVVEGSSIVESDFDEGDGLTVRRYNARHYTVSETLDADGLTPIVR